MHLEQLLELARVENPLLFSISPSVSQFNACFDNQFVNGSASECGSSAFSIVPIAFLLKKLAQTRLLPRWQKDTLGFLTQSDPDKEISRRSRAW
jgi:hypothetical protein